MRAKLILYPALTLLARLHCPRLAARLLAMSVRPLPGKKATSADTEAAFRVLVLNLNKPGFLEDIEDSLMSDGLFNVICWPNYVLKAFATGLLAPQLNNKRYDSDDPAIENSKQNYRRFLTAMWDHFRKIVPTDAVISANFGYFAQREFGAALKELRTPFIVLHKENVKSPDRVKYWEPIYRTRGAFEGSKILVYNSTERDLQISTGVASPEQVAVTGMPRLDRIHQWRREHARQGRNDRRPQLLFFSFWRKEKLTATERITEARTRIDASEGKWAELSWTGLCEGTHKAIVELARQNPTARVVIKTKAHSRRVDDILAILKEDGLDLPTNISIVSGGDPFPLLMESDVVVGFNTTALLEALAAGKPVIVPQFAEADDVRMQPLVIDVGAGVERARSTDELIRLANTYLKSPPAVPEEMSEAASQSLKYWVGNDDGKASQRVQELVGSEILASRRPQV